MQGQAPFHFIIHWNAFNTPQTRITLTLILGFFHEQSFYDTYFSLDYGCIKEYDYDFLTLISNNWVKFAWPISYDFRLF